MFLLYKSSRILYKYIRGRAGRTVRLLLPLLLRLSLSLPARGCCT
jgi:hypothetical protein